MTSVRVHQWLVALLFLSQGALAHTRYCEQILGSPKPLTAPMLRTLSAERVARNQMVAPLPSFDSIEVQAQTEQVGEQGPLALQQMLNLDTSFVATPAPTSPDISTVSLLDEANSFPVHVDVKVKGKRRSTAVYATLPQPAASAPGQFLVGSNYSTVLVFLHGGGTPTATGKNGMAVGEKMVARGIPVIAPDMPGHGRATRNPDGLMTFQEQVDWLMQVIDQLVHPNVKIVLAGHSWGGEFAAFMHRLSADPKYARIAHYISLSPPVDTAVGGGPLKRIEHEQWFQKNFETLKARIAPTDFEFLSNVLKAGKNSDVGGVFTGMTHLDYSLPPLTPEEQKKLKPLTVVVGEADGLVYVGREKEFEQVFGNLQGPSRFIKLGPGRTFESKGPDDVFPTGHGIFDVYAEGTTSPLVYQLIADVAKSAGAQLAAPTADKNLVLADKIFRHWANFFAFREMIIHLVEFVETPTANLPKISERKRMVDDVMKAALERRSKGQKEVDAQVTSAAQELRNKLGIKEPLTPDRAREELAQPPLDDARKKLLQDYISQIDAVELALENEFRDPQSDEELAKLKTEFAKLMAEFKMEKVKDYEPHLKALNTIKQPDKNQERQRKELARLSQTYLSIQKGRSGRFGVERDRRLAGIKAPLGMTDYRVALRELRSDRSPERQAKLRAFVEQVAQVEADARRTGEQALAAQIAGILKALGPENLEQAEAVKNEVDARLAYTYIPPNAPDLIPVAHRIRDLQDEIKQINSAANNDKSILKLEATVRDMKAKRAALIKKWTAQWKDGAIKADNVDQVQRTADQSLEAYKEINAAYEDARNAYWLKLDMEGRRNAENLLASTPEVQRLRQQMFNARKVYLTAAAAFESARWAHASAGEIKQMDELIKAEEHLLEQRRQRQSLATRELNELRVTYSERMIELGLPVPYKVEGFPMYNVLNQPLTDLLRQMSSRPQIVEAMQSALTKWENFLREIRRDRDSAAGTSY